MLHGNEDGVERVDAGIVREEGPEKEAEEESKVGVVDRGGESNHKGLQGPAHPEEGTEELVPAGKLAGPPQYLLQGQDSCPHHQVSRQTPGWEGPHVTQRLSCNIGPD